MRIREMLPSQSFKNELSWLGLFLLLIFPVLGNALSYGWFDARRPFQFFVLFVGLTFLFSNIRLTDLIGFKKILKVPLYGSLMVQTLSLLLILVFTEELEKFGSLSFQKGMFTYFYLFLFGFLGFFLFKNRKNLVRNKLKDHTNHFALPVVVGLIGLFIVFKSWWIGPMELQAHIDFGGSTTVVGLCATATFFVILFSLPSSLFVRLFVSLPYLYLLFFSTSRTAYVVFFTFSGLLLFRAIHQGFRANIGDILRGLFLALLPMIALAFILFPLKLSSRFYPFYVSPEVKENIWTYDGRSAQMKKVGADELIVYRQEELWNRLSRFVRALYNFYQSPIIRDFREFVNDLFDAQLMPDILVGADDYLVKGGHDPNDRWARLAAQSTRGESRTQIIRKTNVLISERPQGWWPGAYPDLIDFYCNADAKCRYPHNIVLEVTFYFGLLMGFAYFLLIAIICWFLSRLSLKDKDPLTVGLSIGILVALFGAQFTGTFYDLLVAGFLMVALLVNLRHIVEENRGGEI